jgi:hypothetical protein
MPQSSEHPANEYSSTYMVHDRRSQQELTRITIQDHLITTAMSGVLPEQPDPSIFQRVLDIGFRPFIQKWGCVSSDYDALYSQLLEELRQPTYHSTWKFLTAWGTRLAAC